MADADATAPIVRRHRLFTDMTGQTFGRLLVVDEAHAMHGRPFWRCRCLCGGEKVVLGKHLRLGAIRSCGCVRRENTAKTGAARAIDRTGLRYGRLTVIGRAPNSGRTSRWNCVCDCETPVVVTGNNLNSGQVSCGCARGRQPVRDQSVRAATRVYQAHRRKTDSRYRIEAIVRAAVHKALRKRGAVKVGRLWEILGYTFGELEQRLRRTLPSGYSWDDFMRGRLHIDHRIPLAVFNYKRETDHDFKRAWALTNLQLLPGADNMAKGSRLAKPFQPGLAF